MCVLQALVEALYVASENVELMRRCLTVVPQVSVRVQPVRSTRLTVALAVQESLETVQAMVKHGALEGLLDAVRIFPDDKEVALCALRGVQT